jgi:Fe-S cluster biogenesis protein NfuA
MTDKELNSDKIAITAEPTSDPNVCNFRVDRPLWDEGAVTCRSQAQAVGSALFEALFAVAGVREVMVSGDTVTVAKSSSDRWADMGKQVGRAIREALRSGKDLVLKNQEAAEGSGEELMQRVNELLEQGINAYVKSHGGRITVKEIRDGTVYVQLSGGCQGCAAASVTLRQGVERMLVDAIPQIRKVVDVTDHSQGRDPYYGSSSSRSSG